MTGRNGGTLGRKFSCSITLIYINIIFFNFLTTNVIIKKYLYCAIIIIILMKFINDINIILFAILYIYM